MTSIVPWLIDLALCAGFSYVQERLGYGNGFQTNFIACVASLALLRTHSGVL